MWRNSAISNEQLRSFAHFLNVASTFMDTEMLNVSDATRHFTPHFAQLGPASHHRRGCEVVCLALHIGWHGAFHDLI